jgi:hypothetical protein
MSTGKTGQLAGWHGEGQAQAVKWLALKPPLEHPSGMGFVANPVSLTAEQVAELNGKLSDMRHDINNHLSMIVAATELLKYSPASAARMMATLADQPHKISEVLSKFSTEFEKTLGLRQ